MGTDVRVGFDLQIITSAEENGTVNFSDANNLRGAIPKGVVVFGNSSASHETNNDHVSFTHGGTDGSAEHCIGYTDKDGVSVTEASEIMNDTRPAVILDPGGNSVENGLAHNGFSANTWTADTVTSVTKTATFAAIMFAGEDVEVKQLQVTKSTDDTTPGVVTCTHSLGAAYPNLLIFVGMNFETTNTPATNKAQFSYGLVSVIDSTGTPTIENRVMFAATDQNVSAPDVAMYEGNTNCAVNTTAGVGAIPDNSVSVIATNMDENSFELQTNSGTDANLVNLTVVGLPAGVLPWVGDIGSYDDGGNRDVGDAFNTPDITFKAQAIGIAGSQINSINLKRISDGETMCLSVATRDKSSTCAMNRNSADSTTNTFTVHSNDSLLYLDNDGTVVHHTNWPTSGSYFHDSGFYLESAAIVIGEWGDRHIAWAIQQSGRVPSGLPLLGVGT